MMTADTTSHSDGTKLKKSNLNVHVKEQLHLFSSWLTSNSH
nr:hypothetical protein [uncultured bacterium]